MISCRGKKLAHTAGFTSLLLLQMLSLCSSSFTKNVAASRTWTVTPGVNSIQEAINAANDGDTIFVLSGIYVEHLTIGKSLSIIGENRTSTIIDGADAETVVRIGASNVILRDFTIRGGGVGITIGAATEGNTLIENNIVYNTYWGIYGDRCGRTVIANSSISFNGWDGIFLYASEPSIIENNLVASNGEGIRLRYSSNNTIKGNMILSNDNNGIYIWSDDDPLRPSKLAMDNTIENNHISNNKCGIHIGHFALNVTLARNTIHGNLIAYNNVGLDMSGSNGNMVHLNNFINNSQQLSLNGTFNNSWDDGYYKGGNYWSDHSGPDLYWGPTQNETGSDGIIDTPYLVSGNPGEQDRYPFVYENEWLSPPEVNITSPSNATYRLDRLPLSLTTNKPAWLSYSLDNQTETAIENNTILTDILVGRHSITVHAKDGIGNEALSRVFFNTTFIGDVNLDMTVDILDVSIVARSFGSNPSSERWNPEADFNHDGIIDIIDIATVAREFGKTA